MLTRRQCQNEREWLGPDNTPWPLSFIRLYEWMGLWPTSFPVRSRPDKATRSCLYAPRTSKIVHRRHFFATYVHIWSIQERQISLNRGKDLQAVRGIVLSSMFERQNSFTFLSFQTELVEPKAALTERLELYLLIGRNICHLCGIFKRWSLSQGVLKVELFFTCRSLCYLSVRQEMHLITPVDESDSNKIVPLKVQRFYP